MPDAWRRLYYPIEEGGFLAERAREFSLDPAILRALVRQESLFEAQREIARGRARADAAPALDGAEPREIGPARAVPPRLPLRPGLQRAARRRVLEAPLRPVRRKRDLRARRLQRRPGPHGERARRENPRPRRGRGLRVPPGLGEPRLRAARDALLRVLPRALSAGARSPRALRHHQNRARAPPQDLARDRVAAAQRTARAIPAPVRRRRRGRAARRRARPGFPRSRPPPDAPSRGP